MRIVASASNGRSRAPVLRGLIDPRPPCRHRGLEPLRQGSRPPDHARGRLQGRDRAAVIATFNDHLDLRFANGEVAVRVADHLFFSHDSNVWRSDDFLETTKSAATDKSSAVASAAPIATAAGAARLREIGTLNRSSGPPQPTRNRGPEGSGPRCIVAAMRSNGAWYRRVRMVEEDGCRRMSYEVGSTYDNDQFQSRRQRGNSGATLGRRTRYRQVRAAA